MTQPKAYLVVAVGVGTRGKSTTLRALAEILMAEGRAVRLWDADPANANPQLAAHFDKVEAPSVVRDETVRRRWLEAQLVKLIEGDVEDGVTILLDIGPDDMLLRGLSAEFSLVRLLEDAGIAVTALHVVGTAEHDLRFFKAVEDAATEEDKRLDSFRPQRTVVLMNAGLIGDKELPSEAFATQAKRVFDTWEITGANRQTEVKFMPRLGFGCWDTAEASKLRTYSEVAELEKTERRKLYIARRLSEGFMEVKDPDDLRQKMRRPDGEEIVIPTLFEAMRTRSWLDLVRTTVREPLAPTFLPPVLPAPLPSAA